MCQSEGDTTTSAVIILHTIEQVDHFIYIVGLQQLYPYNSSNNANLCLNFSESTNMRIMFGTRAEIFNTGSHLVSDVGS